MLMVRLQRVGRKHEPVFRLVLTESQNSPKSGKFLEVLGSYDARRGDQAQFDAEKVKYWISKGAKLSDTVHNLMVEKKVIEGKKINVLPKKSPIKAASAEGSSEPKKEGEQVAPEAPAQENSTEPAPEAPANEAVEPKAASAESSSEPKEEPKTE